MRASPDGRTDRQTDPLGLDRTAGLAVAQTGSRAAQRCGEGDGTVCGGEGGGAHARRQMRAAPKKRPHCRKPGNVAAAAGTSFAASGERCRERALPSFRQDTAPTVSSIIRQFMLIQGPICRAPDSRQVYAIRAALSATPRHDRPGRALKPDTARERCARGPP